MNDTKTFDQCPICHCKERLVEKEVNLEKEAGRIPPDKNSASQQKIIPIMDPTRTVLAFPVLIVSWDFCGRCGYEYPHAIKKERMTLEQLQALLRMQMGLGIVGYG